MNIVCRAFAIDVTIAASNTCTLDEVYHAGGEFPNAPAPDHYFILWELLPLVKWYLPKVPDSCCIYSYRLLSFTESRPDPGWGG